MVAGAYAITILPLMNPNSSPSLSQPHSLAHSTQPADVTHSGDLSQAATQDQLINNFSLASFILKNRRVIYNPTHTESFVTAKQNETLTLVQEL